jgi:SAM-dependent methyltransferase
VDVVDSLSYPEDVPLNKLCGMAELENPQWRNALRDLDLDRPNAPFHRKAWEFAQAVFGLRKLRRLPPNAVALGVGSGHERILYFLANRIANVVATDLYGGDFAAREASPHMLAHPDMFAPFHYRKDRLRVLVMDARQLHFPAAYFDFVFSFSSIEHFGSHGDALAALREMFRVLKPGGLAVITTELILNRLGRVHGFFKTCDIRPIFLDATGFHLAGGPIDSRIERRFLLAPTEFPYETTGKPCVVLRKGLTLFTSIILFLQKPPASGERDAAATGEERPCPLRRFRHKAEITSSLPRLLARKRERIRVPLKVRNLGDVTWYNLPSQTHTVRLGAHLLTASGDCLRWDFARQDLPRAVKPGEEIGLHLVPPAPTRPGNFILETDLVKEGVLWFADEGSPTLKIPLKVE